MLHSCSRYSRTNFSFSSITLLVFHGMRSVLLAPAITLQCQVSSRSILSGICPVCTSQDPTPHRTFVENKDQSAVRPSGDRTVESLLSHFSTVQTGPIFSLFSRFNCPVGRGLQRFTKYLNTKNQVPGFR